jgi:hypothetical protein
MANCECGTQTAQDSHAVPGRSLPHGPSVNAYPASLPRRARAPCVRRRGARSGAADDGPPRGDGTHHSAAHDAAALRQADHDPATALRRPVYSLHSCGLNTPAMIPGDGALPQSRGWRRAAGGCHREALQTRAAGRVGAAHRAAPHRFKCSTRWVLVRGAHRGAGRGHTAPPDGADRCAARAWTDNRRNRPPGIAGGRGSWRAPSGR